MRKIRKIVTAKYNIDTIRIKSSKNIDNQAFDIFITRVTNTMWFIFIKWVIEWYILFALNVSYVKPTSIQ